MSTLPSYRSLITVLLFSFISRPTWANLEPIVQETGNVSVSVDAEGNNNFAGGTISVNKPSGTTVRAAYFMTASNFNRVIADGDVTLTGTPVNWDRTVFNNAGTFSINFFKCLSNL